MDLILSKSLESQQKQINSSSFKSSLSQYIFIGKIKINKQFAFFIGVSYKIKNLSGFSINKKKTDENNQYNFSQYFNLTSSDIDLLNSSCNSDISSNSLFRIIYIQSCYDECSLQRSIELSLWNHSYQIGPQFHDIFYCDFQCIQQLCIWFGVVQDYLLNNQDSSIMQKISSVIQSFKNF